ncbi:OBAP family protein [Pseudacidovorax intermedius]|uniref:OBAP family protein n=1 Tax=Pseudacidovorax intermedius TaxID=433924 RepID=UPI0003453C0A|nr:OBAP family protein [Pseudacidovorax intermedius]
MARCLPALAAALVLGACGDHEAPSPVEAPGQSRSSTDLMLEAGASALQGKAPLQAMSLYLDGFHFYSGHMNGQMEAHHYCSRLNDEVSQCVIYDGNRADAKIMGVEYIVSRRLFEGLPDAEKALWHSHVHEVKSGQLVAPGVPDVAETALMEDLVDTYGKTFHTWHTDQDKELPVGVPQLMMGFTADGQLRPELLKERDERLGIDSTRKRASRESLPLPPIAEGADAWQRGPPLQITDPTGRGRHPSEAGAGYAPR